MTSQGGTEGGGDIDEDYEGIDVCPCRGDSEGS